MEGGKLVTDLSYLDPLQNLLTIFAMHSRNSRPSGTLQSSVGARYRALESRMCITEGA
jgi:hypothetical protein